MIPRRVRPPQRIRQEHVYILDEALATWSSEAAQIAFWPTNYAKNMWRLVIWYMDIYIYMGDMGIKRYQHTVGMGHNLVCIMCQSFSGQKGLDKYSNKYDQYICHYTHKQYWFSNVLRAWFWPIGPMQFGPAPFYPAPRSWWTADSRCPIEPDPVNGLILSGQS